ncbi:MAG TPA: TetR/AcrR family transcriptional regulator [Steroidobacteraceae bacterium]|nr:TetR/AcrR family transcriptional regulator [Steroidobacteraceae bacterium]
MPKTSSTPDRILEASLKLFNVQGFQSVTVRKISHSLDISAGHVGYHFKSKTDIAMALFPRLEEEMRQQVVDIIKPGEHFSAAEGARHASALVRAMWRYRFIFDSLNRLLRDDAELRKRYLVLQENIIASAENAFKRLIAQKEMLPAKPPNSPRLLAECWWMMWLGWLRVEELDYYDCEELPGSAIFDGALKTYGIVQGYFSASFTKEFMRELARITDTPASKQRSARSSRQ